MLGLFGCSFYPPDAMLARGIVIATCPSVRLSVTRQYCAKTKKDSGMISSPFDAKFHHQILRGSPRTGPQRRVTVAGMAKVTISD